MIIDKLLGKGTVRALNTTEKLKEVHLNGCMERAVEALNVWKILDVIRLFGGIIRSWGRPDFIDSVLLWTIQLSILWRGIPNWPMRNFCHQLDERILISELTIVISKVKERDKPLHITLCISDRQAKVINVVEAKELGFCMDRCCEGISCDDRICPLLNEMASDKWKPLVETLRSIVQIFYESKKLSASALFELLKRCTYQRFNSSKDINVVEAKELHWFSEDKAECSKWNRRFASCKIWVNDKKLFVVQMDKEIHFVLSFQIENLLCPVFSEEECGNAVEDINDNVNLQQSSNYNNEGRGDPEDSTAGGDFSDEDRIDLERYFDTRKPGQVRW
jgi:hypothetical protein